MRCFISIDLPETLKADIREATEILRERKPDVRWVSEHNLHITLKFLGDTGQDVAQVLERELSSLAAQRYSFRLGLRGIGVFPDRRRPRVVWIDLIDADELKHLQEAVEERAVTIGFERENRPFSPHLTIGRVRSSSGMGYLLNAMETLKDRDFGNIGVNSFSLMKSDLKPSGAQYTTLAEFHLNRRSDEQ